MTIAYDGYVEYHDNAGNHGVIDPYNVQWMTAGSGVLHKEYHEKTFAGRGDVFHIIQLWINLPREYKMSSPRYQTLLNDHMSRIESS